MSENKPCPMCGRTYLIMPVPEKSNAEFNKRVGRNIRRIRFARRLTMKEVSFRLGLKTHQTLSMIETGARRVTPERLFLLAKIFKVRISDLLVGDEP